MNVHEENKLKYSENFEKWIAKQTKRRGRNIVAAFSATSLLDGATIAYDKTKTQASNILIGIGDFEDGWLHGSRLSDIISNGTRAKVWAYSRPQFNISLLQNWVEEYKEKGVCFIDPEHRLYSNWDYDSETERHCKYCGYKERRFTELVPRHHWAFI